MIPPAPLRTEDLPRLRAALAREAFAPGAPDGGRPRVGAEVELIPVEAATGRAVPIVPGEDGGPATLPLLRRLGAERGWREEPSPYGAPRFLLPDGSVVSWEPGGQVELSAAPRASVTALARSLRETVLPLRGRAREEGIELLALGMDPLGTPETVPLRLPGRRYAALTEFLEAIGTGGTRMMRLTAACQPALDWGPDPLGRWRFLNAAAPLLVAVFAASPRYAGRPTGHASFRARVWRELDGGRTGLFRAEADAVDEYLAFALRAPAILHRERDGGYLPFAEWIARGAVTEDDWRTHLTTLFPEVRPRGFAEVRSPDAVAPEWYAVPLVLLAGAVYHPAALAAAREVAGAPDADRLERAGRLGLRDPEVGAAARDLFQVALAGAEALGPAFAAGETLDEARAFFERYTRRGLCPADDLAGPDASPAPPAAASAPAARPAAV